MKNTILIFSLFVCIGLFSAQKPANNRHVSLKECNNDTLLYIRTNFLQNKQNYIGLPMDSLFQDLEVPILIFGPLFEYTGGDSDMIGMTIGYMRGTKRKNYEKQKKSYYEINIYFKQPHSERLSTWREFNKNKGVYWTEDFRNFFKDFIIEDFSIFDCGKRKAVK